MNIIVALYHIETQSRKSSKIYYLAKTIRLNDKVLKVREKLGDKPLSPNEKEELTSKPNLSLEIKALEKKVSLGVGHYRVKYLQPEDILRVEESKYWSYMSSLFIKSTEREYLETSSELQ